MLKRGGSDKVIYAQYIGMKKKKMKILPATYTAILQSLSKRKKFPAISMKRALVLFDEIDPTERSIIHFNTFVFQKYILLFMFFFGLKMYFYVGS
jgi:hypothetical protein